MKILAFTDIHANPKYITILNEKIRIHKPDVVVCCGDISLFEHGIIPVIHWLKTIPLPVLLVHGNHETATTLKKLCGKNLIFLHKKLHTINGITFTGWGGGGFAQVEPDFEQFVKRTSIPQKTVLVTHTPPHNTNLDNLGKWGHVGCKSITTFLKKNTLNLALSGHLHENFGKKDKIGKTLLANPGPKGNVYSV